MAWSPAGTALALAQMETVSADEGATLLGDRLAPSLPRPAFERALATLLRAYETPITNGGVQLTQRLFTDHHVRLVPDALTALLARWGSTPGPVDTGAPEGARRRIDGFVQSRTADAVRAIVAPHAIVADAPLVLVSAVVARFVCAGAVATGGFRVGGVAPVEVRVARCAGDVRRAAGEGFALLRIPAAEGALTLDVVLPEEGRRLDAVEPALSNGALARATASLTPWQGAVEVPTVRGAYDRSLELRNALWNAGFARWFDPERSTLRREGIRSGWLSELHHRAVWSVDVAVRGDVGATPVVRVDRPFVLVLRDGDGAPLLVARVTTVGE